MSIQDGGSSAEYGGNLQDEELVAEYGGNLQDEEDRKVALFFGRGHLKFGPFSARGRIEAPATMAPMVLTLGSIITGGVICAESAWQAGAAVMLGSMAVYLVHLFVSRKR